MTGRTDGAIGYVEYAYALQNKMTYTQMKNRDGKFVAPEIKAFQAAAAGADWSSEPGFGVVLTNQPGAESWPITGATFILMHKTQKDPQKAKQVLDFFDWAYRNGDQMARGAALRSDAGKGDRRGRGNVEEGNRRTGRKAGLDRPGLVSRAAVSHAIRSALSRRSGGR